MGDEEDDVDLYEEVLKTITDKKPFGWHVASRLLWFSRSI
jgi:hypothetical protein